MVHAKLVTAKMNSGKLVAWVREHAKEIAKARSAIRVNRFSHSD